MPGARCARSLVCEIKKHTSKSPRSHRDRPAFPAQWFYGLFRALPGDRAFLPPSPALLSANVTPASGRQDHTSSASASTCPRQKHLLRPPHPAAYVRDDRETPLCVGRDNKSYSSDL